eukprot:g4757.t1
MRARAPPRSAGLLNGHYDRHGGKKGAGSRRSAWKLGVLFLVSLWFLVLYRHTHPGPRGRRSAWSLGGLLGLGSSASSSEIARASVLPSGAQEEDGLERKSSRHKRKKKSGECTDSPLKDKQAFPIYGCKEMERMLDGKTEFLGRGYWREVRLAHFNGQDVAIKTLRDNQEETKRNKERHRWEAVAMDMLKDHPNIVHLLGLCECDMVTEYFPYYLDVLLLGDSNDSRLEEIPIREVIRMALQAARGLQAMHELPGGPVVHADLQPRQLLMDADGVVKINDLNRCRFMGRDAAGEPCPFKISKGNGVWRAPEEYAGEMLTEKLDIYSMGNIFWAMLGRDVPFIRDDTYKGKVLRGERPKVDPSWHKEFVELFQDMWKRIPEERPDAREVVLRLEEMYAELQPEDKAS